MKPKAKIFMVAAAVLLLILVAILLSSSFLHTSSNPTQTPMCVAYQQINITPAKVNPIPIFKGPSEVASFSSSISLLNTGTCNWPFGTHLQFQSGTDFSVPHKLMMANSNTIQPGQTATFLLTGMPLQGSNGTYRGGTYTGYWLLSLPNGVVAAPPLAISFFMYEN